MITADGAATKKNPFEMSSDLFSGSADIYKTMGTGAGSLTNINDYINPFYEQVLDRVLGRMDTDLNKSMGRIGDMAIGAGAFGGARHGLLEAEALGEHNRNVGDVTARLMGQGFDSAAERSYRDMTTSAQGQTSLGGSYFDVGSSIMGQQSQQGQQQQDLIQKMLDSTKGMYDSHANYPMQLIDMMNALMSGDPRGNVGSVEKQTTPGLFDYLSLGLQLPWGGS